MSTWFKIIFGILALSTVFLVWNNYSLRSYADADRARADELQRQVDQVRNDYSELERTSGQIAEALRREEAINAELRNSLSRSAKEVETLRGLNNELRKRAIEFERVFRELTEGDSKAQEIVNRLREQANEALRIIRELQADSR